MDLEAIGRWKVAQRYLQGRACDFRFYYQVVLLYL